MDHLLRVFSPVHLLAVSFFWLGETFPQPLVYRSRRQAHIEEAHTRKHKYTIESLSNDDLFFFIFRWIVFLIGNECNTFNDVMNGTVQLSRQPRLCTKLDRQVNSFVSFPRWAVSLIGRAAGLASRNRWKAGEEEKMWVKMWDERTRGFVDHWHVQFGSRCDQGPFAYKKSSRVPSDFTHSSPLDDSSMASLKLVSGTQLLHWSDSTFEWLYSCCWPFCWPWSPWLRLRPVSSSSTTVKWQVNRSRLITASRVASCCQAHVGHRCRLKMPQCTFHGSL